jgi:hypothetical protein
VLDENGGKTRLYKGTDPAMRAFGEASGAEWLVDVAVKCAEGEAKVKNELGLGE